MLGRPINYLISHIHILSYTPDAYAQAALRNTLSSCDMPVTKGIPITILNPASEPPHNEPPPIKRRPPSRRSVRGILPPPQVVHLHPNPIAPNFSQHALSLGVASATDCESSSSEVLCRSFSSSNHDWTYRDQVYFPRKISPVLVSTLSEDKERAYGRSQGSPLVSRPSRRESFL